MFFFCVWLGLKALWHCCGFHSCLPQHHPQAGCCVPGCRLRPHSCDAAVVYYSFPVGILQKNTIASTAFLCREEDVHVGREVFFNMQNCLWWLPPWFRLFITSRASLKRCASVPAGLEVTCDSFKQILSQWHVGVTPTQQTSCCQPSRPPSRGENTWYATINERPRCAPDGTRHGWNRIASASASLACVSVPVCALSFSGIKFCRQSNALAGSWQLKSAPNTNI